ncbi:ift46, partial [Symbiodinium necroappetens]
VRSIENAEKNPKEIDNWVKRIDSLNRSKPAPTVQYSRRMPDIEQLMQVWPAEFEVPLVVDNGNASICGNVTIVTTFPPADWICKFVKCCSRRCHATSHGQTPRQQACGGFGDIYYHHFMYVGETLVSRKNSVLCSKGVPHARVKESSLFFEVGRLRLTVHVSFLLRPQAADTKSLGA